MIFDYNKQETFTKSINIIDLGNFALRCISDYETDYYVAVKTIMGKTAILKFGPILPDIDMLDNDFNLTYKLIDYKESIISKDVNTFINDPKKKILDVEEISNFEAYKEIPVIDDSTMVQ